MLSGQSADVVGGFLPEDRERVSGFCRRKRVLPPSSKMGLPGSLLLSMGRAISKWLKNAVLHKGKVQNRKNQPLGDAKPSFSAIVDVKAELSAKTG